jgi:hypothetical protein
MSGAIPPLPQYAFMAWYPVKSTGLYQIKDEIHGARSMHRVNKKCIKNLGWKT